jgi:hypothetical protein
MEIIPHEVREAAILRARVLRAQAMHRLTLRLWRTVRLFFSTPATRPARRPGEQASL